MMIPDTSSYLNGISASQMEQVLAAYPADPAAVRMPFFIKTSELTIVGFAFRYWRCKCIDVRGSILIPFPGVDLVTTMLRPQYKRLAAIQGDIVFQAPRRFFLQSSSDLTRKWSYSEVKSPCLHPIIE